jgi:WD40 repeat protein/serine/threonine protein kinase
VPEASLFKNLSPAEFSRISQLLDESLELSSEERLAWLAQLERSDSKAAQIMRKLFESQNKNSERAFLEGNLAIAVAGPNAAESSLVGKQFGPYRVLSLIGHGGMGSVWLAERADGLFTRQVALKLIHPALMSKIMTERATREREILAGLNHPNIARLIDAGFSEDSQPYLALEYVQGRSVIEYCDGRRLAVRERLELFRQILAAVQYAHSHLVIHRDLKPSNILVTDQGQVSLLDFGIAKLLTQGEASESELTRIGGRAMTPDYAAPEQIAGEPISTAADVYALGVIFYELLSGERPYKLKRESVGALEEAILRVEPAAPSRAAVSESVAGARSVSARKLQKSLSGDLDTIALKALKKKPAERYATANAFDEDISRYLGGEVVLAQPDSLAYRAAKFIRRHRVGLGATAVLILVLAAGLVATTYEAGVAAVQRDAALKAQLNSVTQTAAERLKNADVAGAMGIILEVLPKHAAGSPYGPEALNVFQEARAADAQVAILTGHTDEVRSAVFSPDGSRIVTASYDRSARVWDVASGAQTLKLSGHSNRLRYAAFSPDGRRIVTASLDKTARIWDAATGKELMVLQGHTDRIRHAVFSPDGRRVVTASYDKTARIWNAETGQEIMQIAGHAALVASAAFSSDGRRVLTASFDNTARVWDALSGKELLRINSPLGGFNRAAFSPSDDRIVTSSDDTTVRIWDAATGRAILLLGGHEQAVEWAAFSADGNRVVTASDDDTVRVWDALTGRQMLMLKGHRYPVVGAAFSPDGLLVVSASGDHTARIWNAAGGEVKLLKGHTQALPGADYSADGLRIATASVDRTARVWDAASGAQLAVLSGHTQLVLSAEFSPDGKHVATASDDHTARVWDAATGEQVMLLAGHTMQVEGANYSPDGAMIVTASFDKTARIWNVSDGRQLRVLEGHTGPLVWAEFSPDGHHVVTASGDQTARIWDATTGHQIQLLSGHSAVVSTATFSPDGRNVLTASEDKTMRIWDGASGRELRVFRGHESGVSSANYSSDGARIVSSSNDHTARIWDALTGEQIKVIRHGEPVNTAVLSRDGRYVLTSSYSSSAHIWDAAAAPLDTQILWAEAAQFDELPSVERSQLGLPETIGARQWRQEKTPCDESAAAPYDPQRRAPGHLLNDIVADIAVAACAARSENRSGSDARFLYQHGRALLAAGNFPLARQDLEKSVSLGWRSARIDLAALLTQKPEGAADLPRAAELYERAWNEGVPFAGFALGHFFEVETTTPDVVRAWLWYSKAADAGEPNALARFGARAEAAALGAGPADRNALWLESFKYYAAATLRARGEDWPDGAWRDWRYRRATLARLLAREGSMQAVADAYGARLDSGTK